MPNGIGLFAVLEGRQEDCATAGTVLNVALAHPTIAAPAYPWAECLFYY